MNVTYTHSCKAARLRKARELAVRERKLQAAAAKSPDELLESGEMMRLVQTALQLLDPRFSQVLVMKEIENLEVADIARILNLPEGTVKSRLLRETIFLSFAYCSPLVVNLSSFSKSFA